MKAVTIIIPVYNEQASIGNLVSNVSQQMADLPYTLNFLFVDDGSQDATLDNLKQLAVSDTRVKYISFSRNFGHQSALKAGLDQSSGDCVISMDGDGQHPADIIPVLLRKYEEGYDVVYTIRSGHEDETFFKRLTSRQFYAMLNRLSEVKLEKGTADFRLLSRRVTDIIRNLPEYDLFFRGMVKWVGFKQVAVEYTPSKRAEGKSRYTFRKMIRLALNGILSFSTRPLRFAVYLGLVFALLSVLYLPYALVSYFSGHYIQGWTSVIMTISFFGGIQLMILGIMGLYIGSIFMQGKGRPHYIIKESNLS